MNLKNITLLMTITTSLAGAYPVNFFKRDNQHHLSPGSCALPIQKIARRQNDFLVHGGFLGDYILLTRSNDQPEDFFHKAYYIPCEQVLYEIERYKSTHAKSGAGNLDDIEKEVEKIQELIRREQESWIKDAKVLDADLLQIRSETKDSVPILADADGEAKRGGVIFPKCKHTGNIEPGCVIIKND
ncbi:hypothetical protein V1514DRAFT_342202 [Lipomyces japonicus]|uniref:uncharacterized protein n=1 Tax=Lipomyces japonicus TaxID=56871 RepID=UPI0034CD6FE9